MERTREEYLNHADKLNLILVEVAKKLKSKLPFEEVKVEKADFLKLGIQNRAELGKWMLSLIESGYLKSREFEQSQRVMGGGDLINKSDFSYSLTVVGWNYVESLYKGSDSKNVFLAIKFKNPERKEIQEAMKNACLEKGWELTTIDHEEYLGGV